MEKDYTLSEIRDILRELFLWEGNIEQLLIDSETEGQINYSFSAEEAIRKLNVFVEDDTI